MTLPMQLKKNIWHREVAPIWIFFIWSIHFPWRSMVLHHKLISRAVYFSCHFLWKMEIWKIGIQILVKNLCNVGRALFPVLESWVQKVNFCDRHRVPLGRLFLPVHSPVVGAGDHAQRGLAGGSRLRHRWTEDSKWRRYGHKAWFCFFSVFRY